ncbi:hypothetical protein PHBOTO_000341 [Pseudozyma hubeiensis]|nr:hypothetical protein PHBOTO_000341 [Pseudozyma hubeiensis]
MSEFEYKLLYSRGAKPLMSGKHLHIELETTGVPPGGVRWAFSTRYRPSKPSYRNVLLQGILEMCKKHNLTPLEIRPLQGGRSLVDVIFANGDDVMTVYEGELTFDFYGTQPELVDRAMPDRKHVALCIQTLPARTNLRALVPVLQEHPRISKAGTVVDVWSAHCSDSKQFKGKILVLLELFTQNGVVPLETRAAIPGWFVFDGVAYLVLFPDRPAWCVHCRYSERGPFHSRYTCPALVCATCAKHGHTSVDCGKRQKQVACKKPAAKRGDDVDDGDNEDEDDDDDDDDDDETPRAASKGRESMERRFAELGIRDGSAEAEELARDFGVLALSESDIGA